MLWWGDFAKTTIIVRNDFLAKDIFSAGPNVFYSFIDMNKVSETISNGSIF